MASKATITARKAIRKKPKGFSIVATIIFSVLSIVLVSIGIWLVYSDQSATGISQSGKYGQGGGQINHVPGWLIISLGGFFGLFPLIDLYKYILQKFQRRQIK